MRKYAEDTTVPVDRSRAEIEKILTRYGADQYSSGWAQDRAVIMFRMNNRLVRVDMPLPVLSKAQYNREKEKGKYYTMDAVAKESRRRWRALVLYIKAKLESVESEIVSFEQAFLSHILLPNKQTAGEFLIPQIEHAYQNNEMPPLLGYGG